MSIWSDMAKYNAMKKEFYIDEDNDEVYQTIHKYFDTSNPDYYYGDFKLVTTITPRISGTIRYLYLQCDKVNGSQRTGKVCAYEIRDADENVLESSSLEITGSAVVGYTVIGHQDLSLLNYEVKAFSTLKVYFQSYNPVINDSPTYVPLNLTLKYAVRDKDYFEII